MYWEQDARRARCSYCLCRVSPYLVLFGHYFVNFCSLFLAFVLFVFVVMVFVRQLDIAPPANASHILGLQYASALEAHVFFFFYELTTYLIPGFGVGYSERLLCLGRCPYHEACCAVVG